MIKEYIVPVQFPGGTEYLGWFSRAGRLVLFEFASKFSSGCEAEGRATNEKIASDLKRTAERARRATNPNVRLFQETELDVLFSRAWYPFRM